MTTPASRVTAEKSEVQHTAGPWQATENAYGCQFVQRWEAGEAHDLICGGNSHDTLTKGNARLIAAAPEMLEAVRKASQLASIASDWNLYEVEIDGAMVGIYALMAEFDAALAKAEGRS